ncbi:integrase/recombinase XerD [Clostridium beijerinckii]|uniref:tyrosine-type recombinase/integrase n=1 Tax=Clostridium beijerinckii TaxID=1520 RepID=UPI001493EB73|nr:site-specific integrase [Clostridium beijerinckii]NOW89757.1 integrase/recombinase XerD [Clostridium beijerinckii]
MKVKGLFFNEDIVDKTGRKISRIMFDNNCKALKQVNEYLWEIEKTKTNSYNSIKRYGDDLCYFYNFLLTYDIKLLDLNSSNLSKFVEFLKKIKVKNYSGNSEKKRYSVENSLENNIKFLKKSDKNILLFGRSEGLNQDSVRRIFVIVINYLRYLIKYKGVELDMRAASLIESKDIMGILKANGIYKKRSETVSIDANEIISGSEYKVLLKNCKSMYGKLLFYILYNTGMRIGEALGLKLEEYNIYNLKESLKGDISYKDGRWLFNIEYRDDNQFYKLAKGHRNRSIYLKKSQSFEFEMLLEKYLIKRNKVKKEKNIKWLFLSSVGTELTQNTAYKCFKNCLDKSNLSHRKTHLTLHSMRHTFITNEIENRIPIVYVSLYVGHRNLNTTIKKYLHLTSISLSEIREKYDEFVNIEFDMSTALDIDIK